MISTHTNTQHSVFMISTINCMKACDVNGLSRKILGKSDSFTLKKKRKMKMTVAQRMPPTTDWPSVPEPHSSVETVKPPQTQQQSKKETKPLIPEFLNSSMNNNVNNLLFLLHIKTKQNKIKQKRSS